MTANEKQFTPGPWKQNGRNGIHTKEGICIATTHHDENRLADSVLISFAPDMLEMPQDILDTMESGNAYDEYRIRILIAKATTL